MTSPLITLSSSSKPQGTPKTGDLVTFLDYADRRLCGRVRSILRDGTVDLVVIGLSIPEPYRLGDTLGINPEKVIDWG